MIHFMSHLKCSTNEPLYKTEMDSQTQTADLWLPKCCRGLSQKSLAILSKVARVPKPNSRCLPSHILPQAHQPVHLVKQRDLEITSVEMTSTDIGQRLEPGGERVWGGGRRAVALTDLLPRLRFCFFLPQPSSPLKLSVHRKILSSLKQE